MLYKWIQFLLKGLRKAWDGPLRILTSYCGSNKQRLLHYSVYWEYSNCTWAQMVKAYCECRPGQWAIKPSCCVFCTDFGLWVARRSPDRPLSPPRRSGRGSLGIFANKARILRKESELKWVRKQPKDLRLTATLKNILRYKVSWLTGSSSEFRPN